MKLYSIIKEEYRLYLEERAAPIAALTPQKKS